MPLTEADLPLAISFFNDATGVGKTFAAWRTRYHFDDAKIATRFVCIETGGVPKKLRRGDVFIAVEDFTESARMPGGIAGVLQPYSAAVLGLAGTRSVLIADLAGGLARHYAEYLAATRFDQLLHGQGITTLGVVVATNRIEHMREALINLDMLAATVPLMHRALLLNYRFGGFKFLAGSPSATVYRDLMRRVEDGCAVIRLPAVVGDSWKAAEDAQLTLKQALNAAPAEFAKRTRLDLLTAAACLTEVETFYGDSEVALNGVLRFRDAE
jgi:hypothetical protein